MKLITIFNYPDDPNYTLLCRWWLQQAKLHKGDLDLEVWHEGPIYVEDPDVKFVKKERFDIGGVLPEHMVDEKSSHNIGFKLYNLCQETEPFIFIDADAILLSPIDPLVLASADKEFIAVDHQNIPGHTDFISFKFLNSGVQVVGDPTILDFDDIMLMLKQKGKFACPGTDQAALFMFFAYAGYDYHHPEVGYGWNSCAQYTKMERRQAFCRGLEEEYPVHINHYWYKFKPWTINCELFNNFKEKIENESIADR